LLPAEEKLYCRFVRLRTTTTTTANTANFRRVKRMNPLTKKEGFELALQIEELEAKIAPGGGETVLPLPLYLTKKR